jgi:hypothetical protein
MAKDGREGEAPAEPKRALARRPPEAAFDASGGRLGSAGASPSQSLARRKSLSNKTSKAGRHPEGEGAEQSLRDAQYDEFSALCCCLSATSS